MKDVFFGEPLRGFPGRVEGGLVEGEEALLSVREAVRFELVGGGCGLGLGEGFVKPGFEMLECLRRIFCEGSANDVFLIGFREVAKVDLFIGGEV